MCLEVGCERYTVSTFEKLHKAGKFADEQDFIDIAMPYLAAIKADLKRIKNEVQL